MTTTTAPRLSTYELEASHSSLEFAVKHMMIATSRGRFHDFSVTAEVE
jgi:polyisoprenoid-binding protein YceI